MLDDITLYWENNANNFNAVDKGGHFAAWEQPELFSDESRAAFRSLR
jgi:pimeloyl-ACP methyl ester carboxylesterase